MMSACSPLHAKRCYLQVHPSFVSPLLRASCLVPLYRRYSTPLLAVNAHYAVNLLITYDRLLLAPHSPLPDSAAVG